MTCDTEWFGGELNLRIAIRADGGKSIGMGHIMRTLVLAKELSFKNEIFYICTYNTENQTGIEEIQRNGFKVYVIKENILDVLSNINVDMLITDSYDVDEKYFIDTAKMVKYTAYIDDVNSFNYPVDLVINQNINAEDFNYNQKYKLLGLKYLMLRHEFRNLPQKYISKQVKNIMITMGGSDPVEFTRLIIEWIKDLNFNFHVIIGPSFKEPDYFKNICSDNIKFYFSPKMTDVMAKCDLAVSASGSSIYELLASGVPCLSTIIAENQFNISRKLEEINIAENLGWYYNLNKCDFKNSISALCNNYELRKQRSIDGQKFVDGLGAGRIAHFLENTFKV